MRKLAIILSLWCGTCLAQNSAIESREFDFGNIASSAVATHDFEFKEKIRSVVAMCECAKPTVRTLTRRKETVYIVHVEFDPQGYSGDVKVDLVALDSNNNVINIALKAHVIVTR